VANDKVLRVTTFWGATHYEATDRVNTILKYLQKDDVISVAITPDKDMGYLATLFYMDYRGSDE
jgi:hypothetical protein